MKSSGYTAVLLMSLLLFAVPVPCRGTSFAVLYPDVRYEGRELTESGELQVELQLMNGNFFSLRQVFVPRGGRAVTQNFTGKWRQVEHGALLLLTNLNGLSLRLNVGGSGNLYGEFFCNATTPPASVALKQVAEPLRSFVIMGRLERSGTGDVSLTDSGSGQVFFPVGGKPLNALSEKEHALFIDAVVSFEGKHMLLEKIRSMSRTVPEGLADSKGISDNFDLAGFVEGQTWFLPPQIGVEKATCIFSDMKEGKGSLEVSGPGLHFVVDITEQPGRRLELSIGDRNVRMLRAAGFESILEYFFGEYVWSREGNALALARPDGEYGMLLEQVRF